MIRAELVKLRRRPLIAWTAALTLGISVAFVVFNTWRHHSDPAHYGPAGGLANLAHGVQTLGFLGTVAAVLVGATAGGQDVGSGVFRDLVTTGTSRLRLFAVRVPAALAFYLAWFLPALAVILLSSRVLAGRQPVPSGGMLWQYGLGVGASTSLDVILSLGLATLLGSRSLAIGLVLGFELAFSRVLEHMTSLGGLRQLLPTSAIDRILPTMGEPQGRAVAMGLSTAVIVLVAWAAAAVAAGAWRTASQDA
jgi:ABC-2 type transport system permease protein